MRVLFVHTLPAYPALGDNCCTICLFRPLGLLHYVLLPPTYSSKALCRGERTEGVGDHRQQRTDHQPCTTLRLFWLQYYETSPLFETFGTLH